MTTSLSSSPEAFLTTLIPEVAIRKAARATGFSLRYRKVDPFAFLLTIVVGLCGREGQWIAAMRRMLAMREGIVLARSVFWRKFTPELDALVGWLLRQLEARAAGRPLRPSGLLGQFKDVVAIDATVIGVHKSLAKRWKGTRHNGPAAIKVHTWVRALTGELLRHRVTPETFHEQRALGFRHSHNGMLFLFDRGYPSASYWWRIHRLGGYFLTRLPASHDPVICAMNRKHRGQARDLVWRQLRSVLPGLQRSVLDVQARFHPRVRPYRTKKGRRETVEYRLVGIRNAETNEHHMYVTNIPPHLASPAQIADLYRLRWEVETFYKTGKSGLGLDELRSSKPHIVTTIVHAALIRASVAMQAKREAETRLSPGRWINPGAWIRIWPIAVSQVLDARSQDRPAPYSLTWEALADLAADPNRARQPSRHRIKFARPPERGRKAA